MQEFQYLLFISERPVAVVDIIVNFILYDAVESEGDKSISPVKYL